MNEPRAVTQLQVWEASLGGARVAAKCVFDDADAQGELRILHVLAGVSDVVSVLPALRGHFKRGTDTFLLLAPVGSPLLGTPPTLPWKGILQ